MIAIANARMTGDWDGVGDVLENLAGTVRRAAEKATERNAAFAAGSIREHIRQQVFSWIPLLPETIRRKGSSDILIDSGDLKDSVTHKSMSPTSAFVGILASAPSGTGGRATLVNIARVHEFGFMGYVTNSKTGTTYFLRIPQRAFIGPTIEQIKDELYRNWKTEVAEAIKRSVR